MKTEKQMAAAATEFAERWKGRGYERGESQLFWADLLTSVYGVENLPEFIRYEAGSSLEMTARPNVPSILAMALSTAVLRSPV